MPQLPKLHIIFFFAVLKTPKVHPVLHVRDNEIHSHTFFKIVSTLGGCIFALGGCIFAYIIEC